jgi:hypothetical protein
MGEVGRWVLKFDWEFIILFKTESIMRRTVSNLSPSFDQI